MKDKRIEYKVREILGLNASKVMSLPLRNGDRKVKDKKDK